MNVKGDAMRAKRWMIGIAAVLLATLAGAVLAQRGILDGGGMVGGGGMMGGSGMMGGGGMGGRVPNEQWRGRDAHPPSGAERAAPRKPKPDSRTDSGRDARRWAGSGAAARAAAR